jgi:WhiB family redox-sensing transcriptional regulator
VDEPWYAPTSSETWRDRAACRGKNVDVWHAWPAGNVSDMGSEYARTQSASALLTCGGCPVRSDCLDFALRAGILDGVWGGMMPVERRKLIRRRRSA